VVELTWRPRAATWPGARLGDLGWAIVVGGAAALVLGWALTVSLQAACAFVLVVAVVALYQHDRRWGIAALFLLWFLAPGIRRVLGLVTGYVGNDPLSLAPFLATAAIASLELLRYHVPGRIRRVFIVVAAGFAVGVPVGLLMGPRAAVFAFVAYLAAVSGAALGFAEPGSVQGSTLRRMLLFGLTPIAGYAILQRFLPLPSWDQAWIDATGIDTIGTGEDDNVRVFGTLNSPGTFAALLAMSLLAYLTVHRARLLTLVGAALVAIALTLTYARSAWVALIVAGLAHIVVTNGRSARLILGSAAIIVAATLALSPVSPSANLAVERFKSITDFRGDTSSRERRTTAAETFPSAAQVPLGHGLGSAGEPSKLTGGSSLRAPDNGYLSLVYQVGPLGFLAVMGALALILFAAWNGARTHAPGQELRELLFAILVFLLAQAAFGDVFYGISGVILWFIGGQVLAYDFRRRRALPLEAPPEPAPPTEPRPAPPAVPRSSGSPDTRFFHCLASDGRPRDWTPPAPIEDLVDTWYFGPALAAMDEGLDVGGLTVYATFDTERLPSYGDDVVVLLIGDEWARVPAYLPRVRAVFRNTCARPNLGCNPFAQPSPEKLSTLLPAGRAMLRGARGRLGRLRAGLERERSNGGRLAPQIELPLGTFNLLDLPLVPFDERGCDVFFAGSVEHEPGRSPGLKARVAPKVLAREAMLRNVDRLREHENVRVDVRITKGFQASATADPGEYSHRLMNSRLALVPRGATTETHRFFQALKYGCVVITDSVPPMWFYEHAPIVRLPDWDELEHTVLTLLSDPEQIRVLHRQSLDFWETACSEAAVGRLMARTLNELVSGSR
jgi:O-Antigen ligase